MKSVSLFVVALLILASYVSAEDSSPKISVGVELMDLDVAKATAQNEAIPVHFPLNLKVGVWVAELKEGGAFDNAGIQKGDIITRVGTSPIKDMDSFEKWLAVAKVGETYKVSLMRMNPNNGEWTWKTATIKPKAATTDPAAAQPAPVDDEHRPYELKGDRLGMTLDTFKKKYFRKMPNDPRPAPFCSDSSPDRDLSTLLYKAEYAQAGIVCATPIFPYEANDSPPNVPTIAGAPAELLVYKFVDNKLYEVTVFFHHGDFDQVMNAVKAKYGEPAKKDTRTYENAFGAKFDGGVMIWSNAVSEITVFERAGTVDDSLLIVSDKELQKTANEHLKAKVKPRNLDE